MSRLAGTPNNHRMKYRIEFSLYSNTPPRSGHAFCSESRFQRPLSVTPALVGSAVEWEATAAEDWVWEVVEETGWDQVA